MKIELAHDSLANRIYQLASSEDKTLLKMRAFVETRYAYFKENHIWLSKEDLNYVSPYLDKIQLSSDERTFIRRSKRFNNKRRIFTLAGGILSLLILVVLTMVSMSQWNNLSTIKAQQQVQLDRLENALAEREKAEKRAELILSGEIDINNLDLNDSLLLKELMIRYDTLAKEQQINETERDIAQSATLSNLAASAKEQGDKKSALELVEKSLELNEENVQALRLLAQLSDASLSDFIHQETHSIIDKAKKTYRASKLQTEELMAIFSEENEVVQEQSKGGKISSVIQRKAGAIRPKDKAEKIRQSTPKPQLLEQFQMQQTTQQPIASEILASPSTSGNGNYGIAPPSSIRPPVVEQLKDIPCELIVELTSDKWTPLEKPTRTSGKPTAFKYDNYNRLSLRISSNFGIASRSKISAIVFVLENEDEIEIPNPSYNADGRIIQLSLETIYQEALLNHPLEEILLILEEEEDTQVHNLLLAPIYQTNFKRATSCFFGE